MKSLIITFIALFFSSLSIGAQEMIVKSFERDYADISAQKKTVLDANEEPCALVKVCIADEGAEFEGDVVQQIDRQGEWWVYLTDGSEYIEIKTSDYLPLTYQFEEPLVKECTYKLVLEFPKNEITIDEARRIVGGSAKMPFQQIHASKTLKNTLDVDIAITFPTDNSLVANNIREYINEQLGEGFAGSLNDGNALANHYALETYNKNKANAIEHCRQIEGDKSGNWSHDVYFDSIYVYYETANLITMKHIHHYHEAGNADMCAMSDISYYTFRKADGRRLEMDMFIMTSSDEFRGIYIEALRKSCRENSGKRVTDEDLCSLLQIESLDNLYSIIPWNLHPFIGGKGICLAYTGTFRPYSYGSFPLVIVPVNQMKPFLTSTMLNLLEK